jgi:hypothetical protein
MEGEIAIVAKTIWIAKSICSLKVHDYAMVGNMHAHFKCTFYKENLLGLCVTELHVHIQQFEIYFWVPLIPCCIEGVDWIH